MNYTKAELSNIIRRFLAGSSDPHEWDEMTSCRNSGLQSLVVRLCLDIHDIFPPAPESAAYCSEEGIEILKSLSEILIEGDEDKISKWIAAVYRRGKTDNL